MQRRRFGSEFKIEAVRPVRERGVSVAQAARDLEVHEMLIVFMFVRHGVLHLENPASQRFNS